MIEHFPSQSNTLARELYQVLSELSDFLTFLHVTERKAANAIRILPHLEKLFVFIFAFHRPGFAQLGQRIKWRQRCFASVVKYLFQTPFK